MQATLALILAHQGDYQGASSTARQSLEFAQEFGNRVDQPLALLALGHSQAALGHWDAATDAYQTALTILRTLGQGHLLAEPQAGLVRVALAQGDLGNAHAQAVEILAAISQSQLDGTTEPILVYLTCYEALAALDDPQAPEVLRQAHALLQSFTATLPDLAMRQRFLSTVVAHRRILASWNQLFASAVLRS